MHLSTIDIGDLVGKLDKELKLDLKERYYNDYAFPEKSKIKVPLITHARLTRVVTLAFVDLYSNFVCWRSIGNDYVRYVSDLLRPIAIANKISTHLHPDELCDILAPRFMRKLHVLIIETLEVLGIKPYDILSFQNVGNFVICNLEGDFRIEDWEIRTNSGELPLTFRKPEMAIAERYRPTLLAISLDGGPIEILGGLSIDDVGGGIIDETKRNSH